MKPFVPLTGCPKIQTHSLFFLPSMHRSRAQRRVVRRFRDPVFQTLSKAMKLISQMIALDPNSQVLNPQTIDIQNPQYEGAWLLSVSFLFRLRRPASWEAYCN